MLTIITVNYNTASATLALLRSLEHQTDQNFDVIVVDNASLAENREELGAYAISSPLHLDIIYSSINRGFSGGNNLAIRKTLAQGSEWIVLLNNDTAVDPTFISELYANLPSQPSLVGIPLSEHGSITYAGHIRWLATTLSHMQAPVVTSEQSLYAIGAGLAVHRTVFARIGLLDERYFLYFEDADFSLRARHANVPIKFAPLPMIRHGVSQSTQHLGGALLLRYHARNALLFNWSNGPWWARIASPFWALMITLKQLVKFIMKPAQRTESLAIATGIIDFYLGRFGKITTINA